MGLGPIFECPENLVERLPKICRDHGLSIEIFGSGGKGSGKGTARYCVVGSWLGRINGNLSGLGKVQRIWLTLPRSHAFNPLLWPINFRLLRRIEALLVGHGAFRCAWQEDENPG
jgi:hypothetical protein